MRISPHIPFVESHIDEKNLPTAVEYTFKRKFKGTGIPAKLFFMGNNGLAYDVSMYSVFLGMTAKSLTHRFHMSGFDHPDALKRPKRKAPVKRKIPVAAKRDKKKYICKVGDIVTHKGIKVLVTEVLDEGTMSGLADSKHKAPEKAFVSGYKIDPHTNRPLTRSHVYPCRNWTHA